MVKRTRTVARAAAIVAAATMLLGVPVAARAATITALRCESGGARYLCDVTVVGPGYAPAVIRWTVNGRAVPSFNNQAVATGACRVGSAVAVSVWVGDPLASPEVPYEDDTESTTVLCRQMWQ
jgi:hypothetical protein